MRDIKRNSLAVHFLGEEASPPPSQPTAAQLVCWLMTLPVQKPYDQLSRSEGKVRDAWLDAVAGIPLDYHEAFEEMLRRVVKRLQQVHRVNANGHKSNAYTINLEGRQIITVWIYRKTGTLCARRKWLRRTTRPRTRPAHLAELLLAANRHVTVCPSCLAWFSRDTTKQLFCSTRCSNRDRASRARRRRGATPKPRMIKGAPGTLTPLGWIYQRKYKDDGYGEE